MSELLDKIYAEAAAFYLHDSLKRLADAAGIDLVKDNPLGEEEGGMRPYQIVDMLEEWIKTHGKQA